MYSNNRTLENSLLIVDEAHNLFNSISNGSKNAIGLYDLIMKTKDIKLIFLTGTPAVNDPFELVSCFNMLKGKLYDRPKSDRFKADKKVWTSNKKSPVHISEPDSDSASEPEQESIVESDSDSSSDDEVIEGGRYEKTSNAHEFTLFPENREDFENWFLDYENLSLKNTDIFKARLSGLVSYYGPVYFDKGDGTPREFFPKELPTIVKKIPMSNEQYTMYAIARDKERAESSGPKFQRTADRFSSNQKSSSTYRVESRQVSNFRFPKHALGVPVGLKMPVKHLEKLTQDDISDEGLSINSPKMLEVYKDVINFFNSGKRLGIFYSSFILSGVKVFSMILEARGWKLYNDTKVRDQNEQEDVQNKLSTLAGGKIYKRKNIKGGVYDQPLQHYKYAIISGDIKPEDRIEIVRIFNSPENAHGGIIDLLLISSTGVEGLDLKGLRFGIMLEPYWHDARRGQFAARMIRYKSHEHLPLEERDCQLVIYLSDYPVKIASAAASEEKQLMLTYMMNR